MRIIKIGAMWCSACLIMNNVFNRLKSEVNVSIDELDYDIDEEEVSKYSVGDVLPVIIFVKDGKEVKRIIGEHTKEEIKNILEELK